MTNKKRMFGFIAAFGFAAGSWVQAGTLGTFTSDANGFDTHTYWYDDGREVTVIDTQFVAPLTQAMVDKIRTTTKSPITRVIITHPNPDKFNGLPLLHSIGVKSIASKATAEAMPGVHAYKKYYWVNMAKMFTEQTYPAFEPVQSTFRGKKIIKLKSGETLTLIELKHSGVSTTQTVVRIDAMGDLLVGDLVHYKSHAWLEGGIANGHPKPDLASWRAALSELPALVAQPNKSMVYGGRGSVGTVEEVVSFERDYLAKAESLVENYVKGTPKADLQDASQAQKHHQALKKIFEDSIPGLAHSYLVEYGIYGLLNAKAQ